MTKPRWSSCAGWQVLEGGEELVVDEVEQLVAGHAFRVGRPVAPAQRLGDRRAVVVVEQLVLGFLVVVDLEEEHPDELADALRVAIDADILAHDVLDGFDEGGEGHDRSGLTIVAERCGGAEIAAAVTCTLLPTESARHTKTMNRLSSGNMTRFFSISRISSA